MASTLSGTTTRDFSRATTFWIAVMGWISLGGCLLFVATRWGIGLYPDSIVYIGAARSVLSGQGVRFLNDFGEFAPVTQYPPLYPWMIAALAAFGPDPLEAARWISIFFYAGNAWLAACIVYRITRSYPASWLASFLSLSAFPLVYIHSQALSEPLFIFLILLSTLSLVAFVQGDRLWGLYGAAVIVGLSCLARYVGLAFLPVGGLVILFLSRAPWKRRFFDAAQFVSLGVLPLGAWVLHNLLSAGNAVNRTFGIHPPGLSDLLPALDTAGYWLLPIPVVENAPMAARSVMAAVFLILGWCGWRSRYLNSYMIRVQIFCFLGYAGFLLVSMSVNNQPLFFDTRTLALPYMISMIMTVAFVTDWLRVVRAGRKSPGWFAFDILVIVALAVQSMNAVAWMKQSYVDGIGLASKTWRNSELINFVRESPVPPVIYSNAPDFIFTLTGQTAALIPQKVNVGDHRPVSHKPNDRYDAELEAMRIRLKKANGMVLYFNDESRLWYLPSAHELETRLPLELVKVVSDGKVYRLKSTRSVTPP